MHLDTSHCNKPFRLLSYRPITRECPATNSTQRRRCDESRGVHKVSQREGFFQLNKMKTAVTKDQMQKRITNPMDGIFHSSYL